MAVGSRPREREKSQKKRERKASARRVERRYINRELSWLDFNSRVLAVAEDARLPLLERAKFLAIVSSNLDEFFQVRVAGLKEQVAAGVATAAPDGMTPGDQLRNIRVRTEDLVARMNDAYSNDVAPGLAAGDIRVIDSQDLTPEETAWLGDMFQEQIFPVLTPSPSTPRIPSPTSRTSRSTWRCWCATRCGARHASPASRCPRCCPASPPSRAANGSFPWSR